MTNGMNLILSGGGSGEQTKILDELFANLVDKTKPLLYLPIAIDTDKHPYAECLKWLKGTFEKLGINKYKMWTEEDLDKYKKININDYGGIYIGGGNTPYLLKTLKESGLLNWLKDIVNKMPI